MLNPVNPSLRTLALARGLSLVVLSVMVLIGPIAESVLAEETLRLGIVGLDTSHAPTFASLINSANGPKEAGAMKIVAAFPGGSPDLPSSRDRIDGFTAQIQQMGIQIVDSIDDLLSQVDAVLLESVDGRKHLEQAIPIFKSGKPVFIDKPLAANLTDAIAIDLASKKLGGRWFSSSSLRFSPSIGRYRDDAYRNKIHGAAAWSPCSIDPTHVDLFWYGIHGVEILYTVMGRGCKEVVQISTSGADEVVGTWEGGRIGSFRGLRAGKMDYGVVVYGENSIELDGKYEGYESLIEELREFFLENRMPVENEETLELMTFMQAAYQSKQRDGQRVSIDQTWQEHYAEAQRKVAEMGLSD